MKFPLPKKMLSGILTLVFFVTNGLFSYSAESNFWAERRNSVRRAASSSVSFYPGQRRTNGPLVPYHPTVEKVSLSSSVATSVPPAFLVDHAPLLTALSQAHGTVRKVTLGKKGGPVIVHIQDVHMNREAQWNIRQTVRGLLETKQVDLLALEGSTEEIELQPFVDFPHRQAVEMTADYLLKENKISGPIHAALTAQGKLPRIVGIDDPTHYQANVQAYKDSAPIQEKTREEIKAQLAALSAEKAKVYSPALLTFDKQVQAYRAGTTSLGEYIFSFPQTPSHRHSGAPLAGIHEFSPHISLFQKALALEKTLDFKQVETERARLIDRLVQKLTPEQSQTLLAQSVAYRSGQLRYADFYQDLKTLCQKAGIRLSDYPAMDDYVKYVLLADGIDAEKLMEEMETLEKKTYATLAKSEEEKSLVNKDRHTWLTGKLVDFALTPNEWRELPEAKTYENFRSFYREADTRDHAMAENVLAASEANNNALAENSKTGGEHHPKTLVLVTGGFHAPGLTAALTKSGATIISFVPKIEKVDTAQGSAYLSVFTQEKSPLEKLFDGQKLFLAHDPVQRDLRFVVLPALATIVAGLLGAVPIGDGSTFSALYASMGGVGTIALLNISSDQATAALTSKEGTAKVEVNKEGSSIEVKQTPVGRPQWRQAVTFLADQFSRAQRVSPKQLAKELVFLAPAFAQILLAWALDPSIGFATLFYSSLPWTMWTLPLFLLYHWGVFQDLRARAAHQPYKMWVTIFYFPLLTLGYLFFSLGATAFLAGGLAFLNPNTLIEIAMVLTTALGAGFGLHRINNIINPVAATYEESIETSVIERFLESYGKFVSAINEESVEDVSEELLERALSVDKDLKLLVERLLDLASQDVYIAGEEILSKVKEINAYLLRKGFYIYANFSFGFFGPIFFSNYYRIDESRVYRKNGKQAVAIHLSRLDKLPIGEADLGHSAGDGLARVFRDTIRERALNVVLPALDNALGASWNVDVPEQVAQLASKLVEGDLRLILSDDEFETTRELAKYLGDRMRILHDIKPFLERSGYPINSGSFPLLLEAGNVIELQEICKHNGQGGWGIRIAEINESIKKRQREFSQVLEKITVELAKSTEIHELTHEFDNGENGEAIAYSNQLASSSVPRIDLVLLLRHLINKRDSGSEEKGVARTIYSDYYQELLNEEFNITFEHVTKLFNKILRISRDGLAELLIKAHTTRFGPLLVTKDDVERSRSPSTLSKFWRLFFKTGPLDQILRLAKWESFPLAVGMGVAVGAHFLLGSSLFWAFGVAVMAGALGGGHRFGTYEVVGGKLQEVIGLNSWGKVLSWFFWTATFGVSLYLLGSVLPHELVVPGLGLATWVGTYFGVRSHGIANREWVVNSIPELTDAQREIARGILRNLDGRPITLDLDQMRELVMKAAENYARQADSESIDLYEHERRKRQSPFPGLGHD
jgi:hypothetical protein